jgi:hypothetical protein
MYPTEQEPPFLKPEDENRSGFPNVVCFLEYQTMNKVQNLSNPDCNAPLSEPFRIYSLMTNFFSNYYQGDQIKEDEIGVKCRIRGRD